MELRTALQLVTVLYAYKDGSAFAVRQRLRLEALLAEKPPIGVVVPATAQKPCTTV